MSLISNLHFLGILFLLSYTYAGLIRSDSKPENRMIDGFIESDSIPYVVSITQNGEHFCGGFIFNNKTVITTAYCVEGRAVSSLRVVVRQVSLINQDPGEEEISVFKVFINENYNNLTRFNDIAIIQLSKELSLAPVLNETTKPSCVRYDELLPSQQTANNAGIYGWGATEFGGLGAQKLRSGRADITSNSDCLDNYSSDEYNPSTMICGSNILNEAKLIGGPCHLDEGGPLVIVDAKVGDVAVVGIFSKNQNCAIEVPSIYTRLSTYYAWINKVAGAQPNDCFSATPAPPVTSAQSTMAQPTTAATPPQPEPEPTTEITTEPKH